MQEPHSYSSAFPKELQDLHKHIHQTGILFSRMALVPALQAELNQNGFSSFETLSQLLSGILNTPPECIRLSLPLKEQNGKVDVWKLDVQSGVQRIECAVDSEMYNEMAIRILRIEDLQNPSWIEVYQVTTALFESERSSLISLPLQYNGHHIATLHLAESEPKSYTDNDLFLTQIVGQIIASAWTLTQREIKLQETQKYLKHLYGHYKTLQNTAEQNRLALDQAQHSISKLKTACSSYKSRAWEYQEKCAELEEHVESLKKYKKRSENNSFDDLSSVRTVRKPSRYIDDEENPLFPDFTHPNANAKNVKSDPEHPEATQETSSPTPSADEDEANSILEATVQSNLNNRTSPSMASLEAGELLREMTEDPLHTLHPESPSSAILEAFPTFEHELEQFWNQENATLALPTSQNDSKEASEAEVQASEDAALPPTESEQEAHDTQQLDAVPTEEEQKTDIETSTEELSTEEIQADIEEHIQTAAIEEASKEPSAPHTIEEVLEVKQELHTVHKTSEELLAVNQDAPKDKTEEPIEEPVSEEDPQKKTTQVEEIQLAEQSSEGPDEQNVDLTQEVQLREHSIEKTLEETLTLPDGLIVETPHTSQDGESPEGNVSSDTRENNLPSGQIFEALSKEDLQAIEETLSQSELVPAPSGLIHEWLKPPAPPPLPVTPMNTGIHHGSTESDEFSLQDFEVEETVRFSDEEQYAVYVGEEEVVSEYNFLQRLQELKLRLHSQRSSEDLLRETQEHAVSAIIQLPELTKNGNKDLESLRNHSEVKTIPIFSMRQNNSDETFIQLYWKNWRSDALTEERWSTWLTQSRLRPESKDSILAIGWSSEMRSSPLLRLLCGQEYNYRHFDNPADGIQSLYQLPPQVLVINLDSLETKWASVFTELSASARTREIPLLLQSPEPLNKELEEALQAFSYLVLYTIQ